MERKDKERSLNDLADFLDKKIFELELLTLKSKLGIWERPADITNN